MLSIEDNKDVLKKYNVFHHAQNKVHTVGCVFHWYIYSRCGFLCVFFFFFSTGLVRLYIAGLPLRSCRTIGAPSVQGSARCAFFCFWLQQDSNPRPGAFLADVLRLRHFDTSSVFLW